MSFRPAVGPTQFHIHWVPVYFARMCPSDPPWGPPSSIFIGYRFILLACVLQTRRGAHPVPYSLRTGLFHQSVSSRPVMGLTQLLIHWVPVYFVSTCPSDPPWDPPSSIFIGYWVISPERILHTCYGAHSARYLLGTSFLPGV